MAEMPWVSTLDGEWWEGGSSGNQEYGPPKRLWGPGRAIGLDGFGSAELRAEGNGYGGGVLFGWVDNILWDVGVSPIERP